MDAKFISPILNVTNIVKSFSWFESCTPTDMSWGVREMHVRHPDGHVFRVGTSLPATP